MPANSTCWKPLLPAFRALQLPLYKCVLDGSLVLPASARQQRHHLNLVSLILLGICMSHAVTACVQVVLRIVLHGRDIRERIGALKVLQAFCVANSEGQQALITTVTLPSTKPLQTTGESTAAL